MNDDSTTAGDRRLDTAMDLLKADDDRRAPGLLVLTACVGLVVAVMALAGATVLAPKPPPAKAQAQPLAASTQPAPKADFELSSKPAPAGSEGSR